MSIALSIILILLELWAFRLVMHVKWKLLIFYTQLSNMAAFFSCIALLLAGGEAEWVRAFRYLSVCMMTMTALVTAFILVPMGGDPKVLLWSGSGLYHHVVCPVINFVSYVFFEKHVNMILLPVLVTLAYGLIMLWLNWKRIVDGPYPFFRVHNQSKLATTVWMTALVGVIALISYGIVAFA